MASKLASITALLIYSFHQVTSQEGLGCVFKTCSVAGQVRINAIKDANGNHLGGCNCGCDPALGDPNSAKYCGAGFTVNFDFMTQLGDCSCIGRAPTVATTPPVPVVPPAATIGHGFPAPGASLPPIPRYTNPPVTPGQIGAPLPFPPLFPPIYGTQVPGGAAPNPLPNPNPNPTNPNANPPVTGGGLPPLPPLPAVPAPLPTVYVAPAPYTQICNAVGPCSCPIGHVGRCTIICEGGTDACKDALIECNNDGYDCTVNCNMETSCGGATSIMGPANGKLTVNCDGEKSCEGGTQFNGEMGTDMFVRCNGITSCKSGQFNFGRGVSKVTCEGDPDGCMSAVWNLLPGARTMPGAAFACIGPMCPIDVPEAFDNVPGGAAGGCNGPGPCQCSANAMEPCALACDGIDACKDGIVSCTDGQPCIVDCISENACSGSTVIKGPVGESLVVNCMGGKACEGSVTFDAAQSTDVTILCIGNEACKGGGVAMNFGTRRATVECLGVPDSCKDAQFNLLTDAQTTPGMGFSCTGTNCPAQPANFQNAAPIRFTNSATTTAAPVQTVQSGPRPVVPAVPSNNIPYNYVPPQTTRAAAPVVPAPPVRVVPPPAVPAPVNTLPPLPGFPNNPWQNPNPIPSNAASPYRCRTSIPGFKPWRGRCWDETTENGCLLEPNNRCIWDAANPLPNPPVNTYNNMQGVGCKFFQDRCGTNSDCCSETCNADATCR